MATMAFFGNFFGAWDLHDSYCRVLNRVPLHPCRFHWIALLLLCSIGKPQDNIKMHFRVTDQFVDINLLVCWLVKSLYGLKQAPQAWYFKLDQYLRDSRVRKTYYEPTYYVKNSDDDILILFCLCWWSSHHQKQCQQDSTGEIWYLIYFWNYWLKPASLLFRCRIFAI